MVIQTLLYKLECGWLAGTGVQEAVERGPCLMYESEGYSKVEYVKTTGLLGS